MTIIRSIELKRANRIILAVGCSFLLLISWFIVINTKSSVQKQADLVKQAAMLMSDGIYIRAVPLLEEAAAYNTAETANIEEELKKAYLALLDTRGYRKKYRNLLDAQLKRDGTNPAIYAEAAEHYFSSSQALEALTILKEGIEKTGNARLEEIYEQYRYGYEMNRFAYSNAREICNGTAQVQREGLWGIARADGILLIPCEYEKISTFSTDRAIVMKNNEIYAVNKDNNRISRLHIAADDFGNYANDRIPLLIDGAWQRATGEFEIGESTFEEIGMYSKGYVAAKVDGKWGVIDQRLGWLIPAEYDGIIQDELGRCYAQGAVFVKKNGAVYLYKEGELVENSFEDARPFTDEGYAAVKKNGKWGYIDSVGNIAIDFQ